MRLSTFWREGYANGRMHRMEAKCLPAKEASLKRIALLRLNLGDKGLK
jgi:hypothetical protein